MRHRMEGAPMAQLRITPLHPSLGAEGAGVDLSAPIDEPTPQELNRALAGYLALPEIERRRLESLTTFNGLDGHDDTRPEDREKYGRPVEHPMVRTHPIHGSKAVYFHISKATHISGLTPEASRTYMSSLLDRMIRPEIVYHHAWRKGDVLVIGDRATMHRAHGDYDRSQSRVRGRMNVEGDRRR